MKRIAGLSCVLVVALFATGCAKLVLKHAPLTPSAQAAGSVGLVVRDVREEEFGGGDELYVGRLRNMYGMPIKFKADNSMTEALTALYTDALAAAGYQVVAGSPTQIQVDVKMFFMDGYMGYKIDSSFDVLVVSGGGASFKAPIEEGHGFAYMRNADMYAAFDQIMDKIAAAAVTLFNTAEFRAAVAGQAAPPEAALTAPAAPPAAPQ